MSLPNRAYRIAKAYLNEFKERIEALDAEAERELDRRPGGDTRLPPPAAPRPAPAGNSGGDGPAEMDALVRRAEERIARAEAELASRNELTPPSSAPVPPAPSRAPGSRYQGDPAAAAEAGRGASTTDPNAADYRLLGVPIGGDLSAVEAAYKKLADRCDPRRFPDGSPEQRDAQRILERVNASYDVLRKRLDPTENRFNKLEF